MLICQSRAQGFIPLLLLRKCGILSHVSSCCYAHWKPFRNLDGDIWMAFLQYGNESEFSNLMVLKRLCYKFGRCSDLVTEGTKRLKMGRCSGGVARGLRQMMGWEWLILASLVEEIAEEEVFDSKAQILVIADVRAALDLNNKSSLIAAPGSHYMGSHWIGIASKPSTLAWRPFAIKQEHAVAEIRDQHCWLQILSKEHSSKRGQIRPNNSSGML